MYSTVQSIIVSDRDYLFSQHFAYVIMNIQIIIFLLQVNTGMDYRVDIHYRW